MKDLPILPLALALALAVVFAAIFLLLRIWCQLGMKGLIFISYRRGDSVRGIGERLARKLGDKAIFLDNDNIEEGDRISRSIDHALEKCGAFLPIIGKGWLDKIRRLEGSKDWVRHEIASILKRDVHHVLVLPVLIDGVQMPSSDQLPQDIRDLTDRQAAKIDDTKFNRDCTDLIRRVRKRLPLRYKLQFWSMRLGYYSATVGIGLLILGVGFLLGSGGHLSTVVSR